MTIPTTQLKTHIVLDLTYHESEGNGCLVGTRKECEEFVAMQGEQFMFQILPMTKEEIENYPDNRKIS